ncbi:NCS2 family permease [Algivirga pacifica]|uniref:NCS2 family permease n=1 Tax=Algivirga pacifica TaxID=1162670 RepID=A0ABP9DD71_9BACT
MKALFNYFGIDGKEITVKKEVIGGVTTFLTMAYILFVNPSILASTGMDEGALFTVTAVAAIIGTLLAAFWGKVPFAMAPGMGLNAFFTYTLVIGQGIPWQTALGIVFLSGLVFVGLTLMGVRQKIIDAIPVSLRIATSAGIGLFISFIGLQNMGLIQDNPVTLVQMGSFMTAEGAFNTPLLLSILGMLLIAILEYHKVTGSIFIGIIATTIAGIFTGDVSLPTAIVSAPPSIAPIAFKLDVLGALHLAFLAPIFSFMFVDLFDSLGTIVACSYEAKLVDKNGRIPRLGRILEADSIATLIGSLLGTSTTTTYIESASGISNGARTGFASVVTAALFGVALLFSPLIGIVPAFATAPALVIVGVFMMKNIKMVDFDNLREAVPAFLTIVLMPLTYSISHGLTFGFLSYVIIALLTGNIKKVSVVMWIIGVLSAINLVISAGLV